MRRTLSWASVESKSEFAVKGEAEVADIHTSSTDSPLPWKPSPIWPVRRNSGLECPCVIRKGLAKPSADFDPSNPKIGAKAPP
jgi:hypothetical protein